MFKSPRNIGYKIGNPQNSMTIYFQLVYFILQELKKKQNLFREKFQQNIFQIKFKQNIYQCFSSILYVILQDASQLYLLYFYFPRKYYIYIPSKFYRYRIILLYHRILTVELLSIQKLYREKICIFLIINIVLQKKSS